MMSLLKIEGVGAAYAQKLQDLGIKSAQALLEKGATPQGRKELAAQSGIGEPFILRWVNHADLSRIKGIGGQYAELLEFAGVDTVVELAQRNAENLHKHLVAANEEKKLVRKLPNQTQVSNWVKQAKKLPRAVSY
jgi:predicted flap endonuclease-1-like 5' DNA nuclease